MIEINLLPPQTVDVAIQDSQAEVYIGEHVIKEGSYIAGDFINIVNNVISVDPVDIVETDNNGPVTSNAVASVIEDVKSQIILSGVSDEFVISDEKILSVNQLQAEKVIGVQELVDDSLRHLPVATEEFPGLVLSSNAEDGILVGPTGTMSINSLNVTKLYQDSDTELVMYGGDSDL